MAPAIVGTVAVDRAVELAKQIQSKMDSTITEWKLTEGLDLVPVESPEPGFICRITPRGILVMGGLAVSVYAIVQAAKAYKAWLGSGKEGGMKLIQTTQKIPGSPTGLIRWLFGV